MRRHHVKQLQRVLGDKLLLVREVPSSPRDSTAAQSPRMPVAQRDSLVFARVELDFVSTSGFRDLGGDLGLDFRVFLLGRSLEVWFDNIQ